jgi:acyl dehydratase
MGNAPIGRTWPIHAYEVGREKIREYASAVGETAGHFHDPAQARSAGFGGVVAPPLFASVFCAPAVAAALFDPEVGLFDPARGIAAYRFVHRTQEFSFERPVEAGELISTEASLVAASERQDGRAERVFESVSRDERGEVVVTARYGGVEAGGRSRSLGPSSEATADMTGLGESLPTLRFVPDRYAPVRYAGASGDFTPFHLDRDAARAVGHDGVILHGMYLLAQAARALIAPFDSDPRVLRSLRARFRRAARPEHELVATAQIVRKEGRSLQVAGELRQDSIPAVSDLEATLLPTRPR